MASISPPPCCPTVVVGGFTHQYLCCSEKPASQGEGFRWCPLFIYRHPPSASWICGQWAVCKAAFLILPVLTLLSISLFDWHHDLGPVVFIITRVWREERFPGTQLHSEFLVPSRSVLCLRGGSVHTQKMGPIPG